MISHLPKFGSGVISYTWELAGTKIHPQIFLTRLSLLSEIQWIELEKSYIRINNISENQNRMQSIRFDWSTDYRHQNTQEDWLKEWQDLVGFNPAHPPCHVHINPNHAEPGERMSEGDQELRLCAGNSSILAVMLSLFSWLKAIGA